MNVIETIEKEQMRGDIPGFKSGDTIKVFVKIVEGQKERIQVFEGVVIRKKRGNSRAMFTVRKVSYSVGVERTFPLHSPVIDRVEVVTRGKVGNRAYTTFENSGVRKRELKNWVDAKSITIPYPRIFTFF
jgi:large subunit ribosomal protein L19